MTTLGREGLGAESSSVAGARGGKSGEITEECGDEVVEALRVGRLGGMARLGDAVRS